MTIETDLASADAAAAARDFPRAARLLAAAAQAAPYDSEILKKLAACQRALGQREGALASISQSLVIDPRDALALLMKGALLEALDQDAVEPYRAALTFLPPSDRLPPPIARQADHAARYCSAADARRASLLGDTAARILDRRKADALEVKRIDDFVAALVAGTTVTVLPGLARPSFFDPALFPGLIDLACDHARFTSEYLDVMAGTDSAVPYVDHRADAPLDQWAALNRSRQWSAVHLWKGGVRDTADARRCPETIAGFARLSVPDIPTRAPNLMFSILAPHTHIPPHQGVINARLVVHIPLIIPPGCVMTVDGACRVWHPGEALVFDDTLMHDARNDSDEVRVVLIGDVWHPDLTALEREVLAALIPLT